MVKRVMLSFEYYMRLQREFIALLIVKHFMLRVYLG